MNNFGNSSNENIRMVREYLDVVTEYVFLNIFWFIFSMPIITIFPATGALYYATNQLAHKRSGGFSVFWEGFKKYFWTSYKWGLLLVASICLVFMNLWFYDNVGWQYAGILRVLFIGLVILWTTMMVHIFPILLEQQQPNLSTAIRNSFVVVSRFPLRAYGVFFLTAVTTWFSTYMLIPLWVFTSMSLIAYLSNRNTINILANLPKNGDSIDIREDS